MSKESNAIIKFVENRFKITNPTKPTLVIPFKFYNHQKDLFHTLHDNRFNVITHGRQMGVSTAVMIYLSLIACMNAEYTLIVLTNSVDDANAKYEHLKEILEFSIPAIVGCNDINHTIRFLTDSKIPK